MGCSGKWKLLCGEEPDRDKSKVYGGQALFMERKSKKMKKWRMMLCGFGMAVVLAACGSDEEDIQIVEQEEIADVSQDAFQDTSQAEDEKTAEPERAEASEGEEAPEGTGESPESEQGAVFEGKAAVVNIETEDQEYKEGETVVMTTSSDRVTVVIEGNEEASALSGSAVFSSSA